MRLKISFKRKNPDFDKEFADFHHEGKDSGDNLKYSFERSLMVENVDQFMIEEVDEYSVELLLDGDKERLISFPKMNVLTLSHPNNEELKIAVSTDLIKETNQLKRKGRIYYYFYFKDRDDWKMIGKTIYILNNDIPKSLLGE